MDGGRSATRRPCDVVVAPGCVMLALGVFRELCCGMRCLVLALLLFSLPGLAIAQSSGEKRATANKLLDALKAAPSEEIAGPLESQIRQLWASSGTRP